jgi:RimJ/RimL family protein N-acetyltransferase
MTTPSIDTRRMLLRPLEIADATRIQELFPHWEVVKHLNDRVPWPYPADGAHQFLRDVALPAMERGEQWSWSIRLKSDPHQLIGCISLMKGVHENRGFWLGLPWHGQGLMTEASDAVTDFWFNTLKYQVLRVPKAAANAASRRISEKQGMRMVARVERDYVGGRLPAEIWEITAEEWNKRKRSGR